METFLLISIIIVIALIVIIYFSKNNKQISSISELFKIDLNNIPDDRFMKGRLVTTKSGTTFTDYYLNLNYKECGIFDEVKIRVFTETYQSYFFRTNDPININVKSLQNLINNLFMLYGFDIHGNGKFSIEDEKTYFDKKFYAIFCRQWKKTDISNEIRIDRESDYLELCIYGKIK